MQLFAYFLIKNATFCDNFYTLATLNSDPMKKYEYINLSKSKVFYQLKPILKCKQKLLYAESEVFKNKDYILTLAKFVDYKINNNKIKYRAKNDIVIIDNISHIIARNIHKDYPYTLFSDYKRVYNKFSIKLKENQIFKILLAQKLILELIVIEKELRQISKIIQKSKKCRFVRKYRKNIFDIAKYYSFLKYHPNSTKLISKYNINKNETIINLFSELYDANQKIKIIITYLKTMF